RSRRPCALADARLDVAIAAAAEPRSILRVEAQMRTALMRRREVTGHAAALATSLALVVLVTGAVFAARSFTPVLSLGVLYLLAVVAVAVLFGLAYAIAVSLASMLAFNFFFLPPVHTFALSDSANWFALGVYLVTAVVVSDLAARSRRRAA